jgi:hypothetical protein
MQELLIELSFSLRLKFPDRSTQPDHKSPGRTVSDYKAVWFVTEMRRAPEHNQKSGARCMTNENEGVCALKGLGEETKLDLAATARRLKLDCLRPLALLPR